MKDGLMEVNGDGQSEVQVWFGERRRLRAQREKEGLGRLREEQRGGDTAVD